MVNGDTGLGFTAQAAVLFGLLGYFSGAIGQWFNTNPKAGVILGRIAGAGGGWGIGDPVVPDADQGR